MKALIFSLLFSLALLSLAGCKFDEIPSEIPPVTFETTIPSSNAALNFFSGYPRMCLQKDGDIRIVANEAEYDTTGGFTIPNGQSYPIVIKVGANGNFIWKRGFGNAAPTFGDILPKETGGYYISYAEADRDTTNGIIISGYRFGLLETEEDASGTNLYLTRIFPLFFSVGNVPATQLFKSGPVDVLISGNPEGNDSLQLSLFSREFISPFKFAKTESIADFYYSYVEQTNDDAFIVSGSTKGGTSLLLAKVSMRNGLSWLKSDYNIGGAEIYNSCVLQAHDGGYLVGSNSNGKIFLLKTDANGNKQWSVFPPIAGQGQSCFAITPTHDGNYLLCGAKDSQAYAAKFKVEANNITILWEKSYPKAYSFNQVIRMDDNGFLMLGAGKEGIYLTKTDLNGTVY